MKYFLSQAVHPLTTTGLAPLVLLSILNYKVGIVETKFKAPKAYAVCTERMYYTSSVPLYYWSSLIINEKY